MISGKGRGWSAEEKKHEMMLKSARSTSRRWTMMNCLPTERFCLGRETLPLPPAPRVTLSR
jgi:hypothetical protein